MNLVQPSLTKAQRIILICLGVLVLGYVYFSTIDGEKEKAQLMKSHLFLNGVTVVNISAPMKVAGIWWINYTYRINGQVYNETRSINKTQLGPAPFYMVGRQFPIIYSPQHLENSKLLVIPGDFNELGIPYPDSLNWVKL